MADNVIQVVIRARDEATRQIKDLEKEFKKLAESGNEFAAVGAKGLEILQQIGPQGIAAAAAIVGLGAALTATTRALLETADAGARYAASLKELSARTGIAIEDLSRLRFAAEQLDTDVESLATGFKFLSRNLEDAKGLSGEAFEALTRLGFLPEQIAQGFGTTEEAILKVSERFKELDTQGQRTAIAMALFGRSGERIIPFLLAGPDAIRKYAQESDRLGATVSTTAGIISDEYVDAIAAANAATQGLKTQVAELVVPSLTLLIKALAEVVGLANQMGKSDFGQGALLGLIDVISRVNPLLGEFARLALGASRAAATSAQFATVRAGNTSTAETAQERGERLAEEGKKQEEARKKAAADAAAAAEQAAKKLEELRKKFAEVRQEAFLVPPLIERSLFGIDPERAIAQIKAMQDALGKFVAHPDFAKGGKFAGPFAGLPAGEVKIPLELVTDPDDLDAQLQQVQQMVDSLHPEIEAGVLLNLPSGEGAAALSDALESAGFNMEALTDRAIEAHVALDSLSGVALVFGEALDEAFSVEFDPFRVAIEGARQAVFEFADGAFEAFDLLFDEILIGGKNVFQSLGNFFISLGKMVRELIKDLIVAIAKALILKSIGFGVGIPFFSGGGTAASGGTVNVKLPPRIRLVDGGEIVQRVRRTVVQLVDGGQVVRIVRNLREPMARMAEGGQVIRRALEPAARVLWGPQVARGFAPAVRMAEGGTLREIMHTHREVVRAAGGLTIVPGALQRRDQVPALLAPGEVVLPFINGIQPAEILGKLARLSEVVDRLATTPTTPIMQPAGPAIGTVNVYANDFDSVKYSVRSGAFAEQTRRALELGR